MRGIINIITCLALSVIFLTVIGCSSKTTYGPVNYESPRTTWTYNSDNGFNETCKGLNCTSCVGAECITCSKSQTPTCTKNNYKQCVWPSDYSCK